jgi:hypothetical protein
VLNKLADRQAIRDLEEEQERLQRTIRIRQLRENVERLKLNLASGERAPSQGPEEPTPEESRSSRTESIAPQLPSRGTSVAPPSVIIPTTGKPSGPLKLKEPRLYKGESIKECRAFLRELDIFFALSRGAYLEEADKVLYSASHLDGDAHKTW